MDVEALLAQTWTPDLVQRIAERVAQPGSRGYVIRAVQHDASHDLTGLVDHEIADAIHVETGVDLDHARHDTTWHAIDNVWELLVAEWRSGGSLPTVPPAHEATATAWVSALTLKAAEWAGCDIAAEPPLPLVIGGAIRIDTEGLERYLVAFAAHGIDPAERRTIHALQALVTAPPASHRPPDSS